MILFAKDVYEGIDALQTVYEAYKVSNVISVNQMIQYADKIAHIKTAVFLIETSVGFVFTDDIGGMATSWLMVGELTKALEGISRHMSIVSNSIIYNTATSPEIFSLLASQVAYARLALLTWSTMANMYQNIANRGVYNVWYWLLDTPNSLRVYQQLCENYQSLLAEYEKQQKDFYDAIDRLFQQSIERVLSQKSSSLTITFEENMPPIILIASLTYVFIQKKTIPIQYLKIKARREYN